jgi:hypothetical protein
VTRRLRNPAPNWIEPQPSLNELPPQRFIPPNILALLHEPWVDVVARAYLLGMAGKKTEDWTLVDLRLVIALVPTLTEMHTGTAVLSRFYAFMGSIPKPVRLAAWRRQADRFNRPRPQAVWFHAAALHHALPAGANRPGGRQGAGTRQLRG